MTRSTVLYVEDQEKDVLFLRRVWGKVGIGHGLQSVPSGEEAVRYLSGEGPNVNRVEHPAPALVLLDLKMLKMSGFEVLKWIRSQPALERLPSRSYRHRHDRWTNG